MLDHYDSLLDRLTAHLGVDPELSLEVRKELRTHLEEAEKDYADGGRTAEEARQLAIKALGDEQILASQLWDANRSRVKLRRWIRRGVLVAMIPLALMVTFWPMWDAISDYFNSNSKSFLATFVLGSSKGLDRLYQFKTKSELARLPEKDRFLFTGDPSAQTEVERARSIRDRWPDDPVYQANLAREIINSWVNYKQKSRPETFEELSPVLLELERGRAIDPTNGYWDFMRFAMLAQISTKLTNEDPNLELRTITRDRDQERKPGQTTPVLVEKVTKLDSIQIVDAKLYAQATEALERAMDTRHYDTYSVELLDRRLALLPKPQSMRELMQRTAFQIGVLLPELGYMRSAVRVASADALAQAKAGQTDLALSRMRRLEHFTAVVGSQSNCLIELLVAKSIEHLAVQYEGAILQVAGDVKQVAANLERQRKSHLEMFHIQSDGPSRDEMDRVGSLMRVMMPAVGGYKPDPRPLRVAEYAMIEQVSIFISLMIFDLLALGCVLGSLWILWYERRSNQRTPLLWIGWRRLAWVLGSSVLLPMAIYMGYLVTPWSGREWGLHITWSRVIIEHVILLTVLLTLLGWLGAKAIRQRAKEVGCLTVGSGKGASQSVAPSTSPADPEKLPAKHPFRRTINGWLARLILVAVAVAVGLLIDHLLVSRNWQVIDWQVIWMCLFIVAFVWIAGEIILLVVRGLIFLKAGKTLIKVSSVRLFIRGWAPILTCAVVLAGAIGYSLSRTVESSAIGGAKGGAVWNWRAEIEESNYRVMRDRMKAKVNESVNRQGSTAISKP